MGAGASLDPSVISARIDVGGRPYLGQPIEPKPETKPETSTSKTSQAPGAGPPQLPEDLPELPELPGAHGAHGRAYDLFEAEDLVRFLLEADVALVRGSFLQELVDSAAPLPRRQELPGEAMVSAEELKAWSALERRPVIWSISHAWESMEHADPQGFQIHRIQDGFLNATGLGIEMFRSSWFFYDYVSLYQYKRKAHEEESFKKAMANMHVLYAHECTRTISIQTLPGEPSNPELCIPIYCEDSDQVEPRPLKSLRRNDTCYLKRGWCQAELLWSSSRSVLYLPHLDLMISGCTSDLELLGEPGTFSAEVPVPPEIFQQRAEDLQFTHRTDLDPVLRGQEMVFAVKAKAESLALQQLTDSDMATLAAALLHFKELKSLRVVGFQLNASTAKSLSEAWPLSLTSLTLTDCTECSQLPTALAPLLRGKRLEHLDLTGCKLKQAFKDLAEDLKESGIRNLVLMDLGDIGGGEALAEAVAANSSVRTLQVYGTSFSPVALKRLAVAHLEICGFGPRFHGGSKATPLPGMEDAAIEFLESQKLRELDLSFTGLDDAAALRLAEAMGKNRSLELLDLRSEEPFSEASMHALRNAWGERPPEQLIL